MSGQPNRYAADAANFRQDYMDSLNLRASLDDQVLQAVKVYKQTGQLPAVSTMVDNRTAEERLKDTESLKQKIIAELKPIGDTQFALSIIQGIMNSPLNTTGSLFTFFAQRVAGIVKNLKESYAIGIKGDANDVQRFISSVEDLYSKDKSMSITTKAYYDRPSNGTSNSLSESELSSLKQQYTTLLPKIYARIPVGSPNAAITAAIDDKMNSISNLLHSDRYKLVTKRVSDLTNVFPQIPATLQLLYDAYNAYNDLLLLLPSYSKVSALFTQLEKSLKNNPAPIPGQSTETTNILTAIDSLFPSTIQSDNVGDLINQYVRASALDAGAIGTHAYRQAGLNEIANVGVRPHPPTITQPVGRQQYTAPPPLGGTQAQFMAWARNEALNEPGGGRTASDILHGVPGIKNDIMGMNSFTVLRAGGEGISGEKKRRGRPKGSGISKPFIEKVDFSKGIQPSPRYISFGRHLINKKKLNDNILSIKTKTGSNIHNTPVTHISHHMKTVIDKIVGGAIPSYEDLSKLSDEEKSYLHKVAKQSDIIDKFSIPAPSKDQEEKEIHEYEVMRGEIMSGNDNKELIKKFKLLIIKLSRRGALPKKEVSVILSELIELGF